MKKQIALKILHEIKVDLQNDEKFKGAPMQASILSYLGEIFGEDSIQVETFSDISIWNKGGLMSANSYIDDLIKYIQTLGVPKRPKENFLTKINSNVLSAVISVLLPGLIYVGYLFGQYTADAKNFRLQQDLKNARDSLYLSRPLPINMPTHIPMEAEIKDEANNKNNG